jgi:hypothetical protein
MMLRDWLIRRAKRTPYIHLPGYMNRWWLVPYRQLEPVSWRRPIAWLLQRFSISARIHEILRSDIGRHPHDHPFNYLTIILKGWYIEHRFDDTGRSLGGKLHGPGSILWRPARSWHLLKVVEGPVTTLFITGSKLDGGKWGFNVDGKKIPLREYKAMHGLSQREAP